MFWTGDGRWGIAGGGDGQLTLGSQALAFTPGRYCTGENVSTKDHMAPFCIEPLDKGVEGGRGGCQKARFQRALAPPTSDSRLAAWGERGHLFPCWLGSCDVPAIPLSRAGAQGGFPSHVLPISTLLALGIALLGGKDGANWLQKASLNLQAKKPRHNPGREFRRLLIVEEKIFPFNFYQPLTDAGKD